jgi:hypothetical protein
MVEIGHLKYFILKMQTLFIYWAIFSYKSPYLNSYNRRVYIATECERSADNGV